MATNLDMAADRIDGALALIEQGGTPEDIAGLLMEARGAINCSRFLTTAELAERWRCSAGGKIKKLRQRSTGPKFIRTSTNERGEVIYPIAAVEEFEKSRISGGKNG